MDANKEQNNASENKKTKGSKRVRHSYKFALWKDGAGFLAKTFGYTINSTDVYIFTRPAEVRKFASDHQSVGFKIVEFK